MVAAAACFSLCRGKVAVFERDGMWRICSFGILLAGLLAGGAAEARPRDEVMAGAYRCAAIASTRVWLDCYYGAAQPQRAQLGLVAAPAAQTQLSLSPPAGGAEQDLAARDSVMEAAGRCAGVGDERQWLDCYYAAAVPVRAVLGLPVPTPPPGPKPDQVAAAQPRHRAGVVASLLGAKDIFIESRMTSYHFDGQRRFTVTLANGQSWAQLEDGGVAQWSKPASDYLVNITGGAFGSFNLAIKGHSGVFKVRRVS
jgi:hypothetical protein